MEDSNAITKRDIVVHVSNKTGLTQQEVSGVLQSTLDFITTSLANGNEVVMRNFGTFEVRRTKPKIGRNPNRQGTEMVIPPRAVVKFKPGKEMREKVAQVLPALEVEPFELR